MGKIANRQSPEKSKKIVLKFDYFLDFSVFFSELFGGPGSGGPKLPSGDFFETFRGFGFCRWSGISQPKIALRVTVQMTGIAVKISVVPPFGSSQAWLFQTWPFAIFTPKRRSFVLICPLLRTCVSALLQVCVCALCAHLRVSVNDRV